MKILLACGKHQYGHEARGEGTEYSAFIPALERLGHHVRHFETHARRQGSDFAELNRKFVSELFTFEPDITIVVPFLYELWTETLDIARRFSKLGSICWTTDDSWKYRQSSRFLAPYFGLVTTTYPHIVPQYKDDGHRNVILTQWAARKELLSEPLPGDSCTWSVTFVGQAFGDRRRRVAALAKAGIEVQCFGFGWPAGPVTEGQMHEIFRRSVISLGFTNSRGANQIKARTFEVPGAGGFLLTQEAPGLDHFYARGEEIAVFRGDHDLKGLIAHYMAHPAERDRMAMAGFRRTLREHTYDARWLEIMAVLKPSQDLIDGFEASRVLKQACQRHARKKTLDFFGKILVSLFLPIFGRVRARRAARRLVFECSWRLFGGKTYAAAGWPGRLFYSES